MKKIISVFGIVFLVISSCFLLPAAGLAQEVTLQVASAAVCKNIVNREVIEEGSRFSASVGKLYCFNKLADIQSATEIVHAWYYGDTERARIILSVNPPAWRTYSSKIIQSHEIGAWRVDILDVSGNLLETVRFDVTQ